MIFLSPNEIQSNKERSQTTLILPKKYIREILNIFVG